MLAKMFKKMKKGNKGFTLVELMVVVVIIGVLTAIAVPVYNNATSKAKINAIAANLRIINGAISQFQANNAGENPTFTEADDKTTNDLVPDYIQSWPNNNPKGVTYKVETTEDGKCYGVANLSSDISGLSGEVTLERVLEEVED